MISVLNGNEHEIGSVYNSNFQAIGYTLDPYYSRMKDTELLHVIYNDEVIFHNIKSNHLISVCERVGLGC